MSARARRWVLRVAVPGLTALAVTLSAHAGERSEVREDERFASAALGRDLAYALYLPPGYGEGTRRYPTLYLLHGVDGNHREWLHDGKLRETADRLIEEGAIAPLIVVMPEAENSWYVDSKEVGGPGDFATAIGGDLVGHVDGTLRTIAASRARGIAGLSMGGFGALRLAFARPYRYAAAASLSGAFWARLTPDTVLGDFSNHIFKGSFGTPFSAKSFLAQSPLSTVQALPGTADAPAVYLASGDSDRYKLYVDTFELFMKMRGLGLPVALRMTAGDHDWDTWAAELPDMLRFFDKNFLRPPS